jgi:hypothetical protein
MIIDNSKMSTIARIVYIKSYKDYHIKLSFATIPFKILVKLIDLNNSIWDSHTHGN